MNANSWIEHPDLQSGGSLVRIQSGSQNHKPKVFKTKGFRYFFSLHTTKIETHC